MTTSEFLHQLRMQDIAIWIDGERLRVTAPHSALTPGLKAELSARKIEIREFLEAATARRSSLVALQSSGSRPAFYGVPADGDVFTYLRLARQLGPDQPFYAFEAPGIDGTEAPLTSIERLAARHLADLRAFQPNGPYLIGGFCLGGIVAFELARQLRAQGQDVALLALFETPSPIGLKTVHRRLRKAEIVERVRRFSGKPWSERLAFVRSHLARVVDRRDPLGAPEQTRGRYEKPSERVFWATHEAAYAYVRKTRTYPGRIVLFLGSEELKRRRGYLRQLDWARVASGGLEVKVGRDDCTDYPMILLDPPHVRALADLLTPYLERVPPSPAVPSRGPS
jgi:thioesterase domain-containing protein